MADTPTRAAAAKSIVGRTIRTGAMAQLAVLLLQPLVLGNETRVRFDELINRHLEASEEIERIIGHAGKDGRGHRTRRWRLTR